MKISWFGQNCFQFLFAPVGKEKISLVVDPIDSKLKKADILLLTEKNREFSGFEQAFLIDGPGEYEKGGVFIQGIQVAKKQNENLTIYTIEAENMTICHLGNFTQGELNTEPLEKIGSIDILMLSLGWKEDLSPKQSLKIISQIEPKVVIPMGYSKEEVKSKKGKLNLFLQEMGFNSFEPQKSLSVKKKDLKEEEREVRVLLPT